MSLNTLLITALVVALLALLWRIREQRRSTSHFLDLTGELGHKLEDLAERYDILTTNLAASVIIRNVDGVTTFCSPYTEVLTGHPVGEFIEDAGDFFESLVVENDRKRFQRAKLVSGLGEDIVVRYQLLHRSGIVLWVETHLVPICDSDGRIESVLAVSMDVTASVRYQQRIEEQNRDLNDFTYMVSHDLKAPIFTIKGMASAIREDLNESLDQESRESLEYIIEAANRLEALVKSVIEYSSLSAKEINDESVSLELVLDEVLNDLSGAVKQKEAKIGRIGKLPAVRGEHLRLYQVFSNLVGNALKYCANERSPEISIYTAQENDELVAIVIQDNGIGIPNAKLKDIFRPYQRAHSRDIEGSGIGLACVKKIVDRIHGTVTVKSEEGQGSEFTITLRKSSPNTVRVLSFPPSSSEASLE